MTRALTFEDREALTDQLVGAEDALADDRSDAAIAILKSVAIRIGADRDRGVAVDAHRRFLRTTRQFRAERTITREEHESELSLIVQQMADLRTRLLASVIELSMAGPVRPREPDAPPLLSITEARKSFRAATLNLGSASLYPRELVAVVGPNGSGKSTFLRVLAEDLAADSPAVTHQLRHPSAMRVVEYVPHDPPEWPGTLRNHLSMVCALHGVRDPAENRRAVSSALSTFLVDDYANHRWIELSTGYRMRAALAIALAKRYQVVALDEPLGPLDDVARDLVLRALKNHALASGTAVILSTQDRGAVDAVADRVFSLSSLPGVAPTEYRPGPLAPRWFQLRAADKKVLLRTVVKAVDVGLVRHYEERATHVLVQFKEPLTDSGAAIKLFGDCDIRFFRDVTRHGGGLHEESD